MHRRIVSTSFFIALLIAALSISAQQPQCPTCPISAVNAKYLQGAGIGYAATSGAGLTLNLAAGRNRCSNTMTNYAGGTLSLTNNTTNYVFLDTTASCAPASNTTGYTSTGIALATVVTSGGVITGITDDRTFGLNTSAPIGGTTTTIASGTSALGTGAISSGTCATVVTTGASGVATTDNIQADFNADPTAVTGYTPATTGMLSIIKYPTSNNVNFKVCNSTGSSITPGAITLNWRVVR
jgi:hypothetical protein